MKMHIVVLTIAALACGTLVYAAPKVLSSDLLDTVSAGQLTDTTAMTSDVANAAASDGSHAYSGAVADHNAIAVNGLLNLAVKVDANISLDNVGNINLAGNNDDGGIPGGATASPSQVEILIIPGQAAIYGNGNETTIDNSVVAGNIGTIVQPEDPRGVIARAATITNAFNVDATDIDVDADINDSFNTSNTKVDICGQNNATAITNANSGGDAQVGASLNVTNATASVPTLQVGTGISVPLLSGNSVALTVAGQFVVNSVVTVQLTGQL